MAERKVLDVDPNSVIKFDLSTLGIDRNQRVESDIKPYKLVPQSSKSIPFLQDLVECEMIYTMPSGFTFCVDGKSHAALSSDYAIVNALINMVNSDNYCGRTHESISRFLHAYLCDVIRDEKEYPTWDTFCDNVIIDSKFMNNIFNYMLSVTCKIRNKKMPKKVDTSSIDFSTLVGELDEIK